MNDIAELGTRTDAPSTENRKCIAASTAIESALTPYCSWPPRGLWCSASTIKQSTSHRRLVQQEEPEERRRRRVAGRQRRDQGDRVGDVVAPPQEPPAVPRPLALLLRRTVVEPGRTQTSAWRMACGLEVQRLRHVLRHRRAARFSLHLTSGLNLPANHKAVKTSVCHRPVQVLTVYARCTLVFSRPRV